MLGRARAANGRAEARSAAHADRGAACPVAVPGATPPCVPGVRGRATCWTQAYDDLELVRRIARGEFDAAVGTVG